MRWQHLEIFTKKGIQVKTYINPNFVPQTALSSRPESYRDIGEESPGNIEQRTS